MTDWEIKPDECGVLSPQHHWPCRLIEPHKTHVGRGWMHHDREKWKNTDYVSPPRQKRDRSDEPLNANDYKLLALARHSASWDDETFLIYVEGKGISISVTTLRRARLKLMDHGFIAWTNKKRVSIFGSSRRIWLVKESK